MQPRQLIVLLALLAFGAKLFFAATTIGSTDVVTFYGFGKGIHESGLIDLYRRSTAFNHTPLVGKFVELAYVTAEDGTIHGRQVFAFLLRLPGILADLCAVFALLWVREKTGRPAFWALALFALSPVAFMVSGYHGNVDSVMTLGVLLAAIACAFERPILCGLLLGLSCNIKIIPVFLAPALFFRWLERGQAGRFSLPAAAVVLVGWGYPLVSIPVVFLKDVLGYSSVWGVWGITYLLRLTGAPALEKIVYINETPAQSAITLGLKLLIIGGVIALAWRQRGAKGAEIYPLLALSWGVFFVFAPGFGAQYLVWLAPFFLLASERWYAGLTAASSVALFIFYTVVSAPPGTDFGQGMKAPFGFLALISHGVHWRMGFTVGARVDAWTPWLLLPWGLLAAYLWAQRRRLIERA